MSSEAACLRMLVTLEAPTATPDEGGGQLKGWRRIGSMWVDLRPVSAWERQAAGSRLAAVSHRVTLRAPPPRAQDRPKPGQRLTDGSRTLLIRAVAEADVRGHRLTCWVDEETPT
jgi:head-tail adaptor